MSRTLVTEFSTERCLSELPYEILFEIFKGLSKDKLIEISRLRSRFRDVAGDKRFWKDVYIKYKPEPKKNRDRRTRNHHLGIIAFENLYSEPWPVKVVDLSRTRIYPPVSPQTDQIVEVTTLDLSSISANVATVEAILTKYQCTELCLDFNPPMLILGIPPEAFSKLRSLEALSLRGISLHGDGTTRQWHDHEWLAKVLSNCKNLKSLNLGYIDSYLRYLRITPDMDLIKHLPTSLEKLFIVNSSFGDSFFKLLAKKTPNLKELTISSANLMRPSLHKFQFLETLRVPSLRIAYQEFSALCRYIEKSPALKTVHLHIGQYQGTTELEKLRTTLEHHGVILKPIENREGRYPADGNYWEVTTDLSAPRTMTMPPSV